MRYINIADKSFTIDFVEFKDEIVLKLQLRIHSLMFTLDKKQI